METEQALKANDAEGSKSDTLSKVLVNLSSETLGLKDFELKKFLGQGAYGKIFLVRKINGRDENTFYAMKVLNKCLMTTPKKISHAKIERNILQIVKHPFLVKMVYAFQTDAKLCFILEYLSGGDMAMLLEKKLVVPEDHVRFYLSEIILALEYLHSLGIIYRDLKPANILLDSHGHIKLTDFGLSKVNIYGDVMTYSLCGTKEYMAPEILAGTGHGKAVDWWTLGILMYDLIVGMPPFTEESDSNIAVNILEEEITFPSDLTSDAGDLMRKLLNKNKSERLGSGTDDAAPIKKHEFFKFVNWEDVLAKRVEPPIIPLLQRDDDVSQCDEAPLSISSTTCENQMFQGFSYVAPAVLD